MTAIPFARSAARLMTAATAVSAAAYALCVTNAWRSYGNPSRPGEEERDEILDQLMPLHDVVERHSIAIDAPAADVLAAAKEQDLFKLPLVAAIFKARALALGASADELTQPSGLLAATQSLGWGVLAERPGREIVVGAVTRPWEPNVTFRAVPTDQFASFSEPGYVKIVWTLRADPIGEQTAIFRSETRAVATDVAARDRFRRYWAFASPGIAAIRWLSLGPLKREAERRAGGANRAA